MRKKICAQVIMLITGCILFLPEPQASIFDFQPRMETGLMYYSIELASQSETTLPTGAETTGYSLGNDKIEFSDNMGFVAGGATFFINRLYADLSAQYTLGGRARSQDSLSEYDEANNTFFVIAAEDQAQFSRTDRALSIGYAPNRKLSIYAGYKWATLDLDNTVFGQMSYLNIDNHVLNGSINEIEHYKFEYEGPFVWLTNGWEIDNRGFLNGLISTKLALACLNSKLLYAAKQTLTVDSINGTEIDPIVNTLDVNRTIKGISWGLAIGIDWRGLTPIANLAYCIGVSGYRYNFDSDDSIYPQVIETSAIFKIGVSYVY